MPSSFDLTRFAIDRDRITIVLVAILLVSGVIAYNTLPKAQDPGFIIRTAVVTTLFPGASPERVELLVTDRLEETIQEMPEVDTITSSSRTGRSTVQVNFRESYTDMRPIFDDLRRKIGDIDDLPAGAERPVVNDEFGDVFGSVYALTGDGFSYAELKTIADEIRDVILLDPDVAKVTIHGAQEEAIFVDYQNAVLTEQNLSPQQLVAALEGTNILSSGGSVVSSGERIALEPSGNFESVDALAQTILQTPGGTVTTLGDIANVYRGYRDPPREIARVNGEPALVLAVSLRAGGDILKLGERLTDLIPRIEASYPWGIELHRVWFQADLVRTNVDNFASNLLQAVGIVVVVMVLFLGLRTGVVVATLIPTTIIVTFFLMEQFDITINQVSLAALIISLGLLVDNAIVVVEGIITKREKGWNGLDAAIESGRELRVPLLVSSLTTAAAFMPIALAESAVGEYTADIFYVVTITLLTSWLLAMTLIPMLGARALDIEAVDDKPDGTAKRIYRQTLVRAVRHPWVALAITVGVFMSALWGLGFVPQVFIPPSEDPVFTATLELPLGTDIETTQDVVESLDQYVTSNYTSQDGSIEAGVSTWVAFVGDGGPRFALGLDPPSTNPANAFVVFTAEDNDVVDAIVADLADYARAHNPDLAAKVSRLENGPPVGFPIVIRIAGIDADVLMREAAEITDFLYGLPAVRSVTNTWGLQTKKIVVSVDQDRALRAGVTSADVAYSLRTGLSGAAMTEYREGDQVIPVNLRTVAAERDDIDKLYGLSVFSSRGTAVPLTQVADVRLDFQPGVIERRNRARTVSLNVQLRDGVTATEATQAIEPFLESKTFAPGHRFAVGGEVEESGSANASIAAKLPLAGMAILLLLIWQFNSMRRSAIVLLTIPLGLIGATIGLLVGQSSFGFFTILGIISLSGIIINNAIVLLDRIQLEEDAGRDRPSAVVEAAIQRFRPILLTTATTVLGMTPLIWGGGPMFRPMAITIIGGLAFATLLTLVVVPVLFVLFFRVSYSSYRAA